MTDATTQAVWSRNFIMVIAGQIISMFGNSILRFALPLYILEISGSAALFGSVMALSAIPMIIMSPIGGMVADRVNKKRIMVALDFIAAAVVMAHTLSSGLTPVLPSAIIVLMALSSIQSMMGPAVDSSVPLLVPPSGLVRANSVVFLIAALAQMIGPAVGGILFAGFGLRAILVVSAVALTLAAIMEMFIRIPNVKQETSASVLAMVKDDMGKSLRFITKEEPVLARIGLILLFLQVSLSAFAVIGIPVMITQNLAMDERMVGIAQAVLASGGIVGGVLAGVLGDRLRLQSTYLALLGGSLLLLPLALPFILNAPYTITYAVLLTTTPIIYAIVTISIIRIFAFIQLKTPEALLGKVVALITTLNVIGMPLGKFIFGLLFERFTYTPHVVVLISVTLSAANALFARKALS